MNRRLLAPTVVLALVALAAAPPAADEDVADDERAVNAAGVSGDGPALLAFFRKRTLTPKARKRIDALVQQLGDDSYSRREEATRELIALGAPAEPALKKATRSSDLEVVRRAGNCLKEIEKYGPDLPRAAARLLAVRNPPGAVAVLLAYLPDAGDEAVEDEVAAALGRLGVKRGRIDPLLEAAGKDASPLLRLAAAHALARASGAEARGAGRRLLKDPVPRVRLAAARSLLVAGDRTAVPALAALLEEGPTSLAEQAEDLLRRLGGEQAPAVALDLASPASRRKGRAAWEAWWKAKGDKIDLTALRRDDPNLGLTLTCECDAGGKNNVGLVRAYGRDGKSLWQIAGMGNPTGVLLLPGRRVLIAQYRDKKIVEYDFQGKARWEHALSGMPVCIQRLPAGNTLVGTVEGKLIEVTRQGKVAFERQARGAVYGVHKRRNGNIVYLHGEGIVELAGGKEVRTIPIRVGGWGGLEVLPGGRFLVAQYGFAKVVEIDATGKVFWECSATAPSSVMRLRNGHTLVAEGDARRLREFDRAGKEVARWSTSGRPFCVRRY
jgi:hypothetical protein